MFPAYPWASRFPTPEGTRIGAFFVGEDGRLMKRLPDDISDKSMQSRAINVDFAKGGVGERVRGLIHVRNAMNQLVES